MNHTSNFMSRSHRQIVDRNVGKMGHSLSVIKSIFPLVEVGMANPTINSL